MAIRKVAVRSKTSGLVTEVAPQTLRYFPDYELVDAPSPTPVVEPPVPVTPDKSAPKRPATTSTEKE
ncbi:hypothetical protein OG884_05760 [Streptosporangium sp. NBC_01755]|uniref:hypothetical protein n=1 Tax=Streptosporangium sp. NBC_01755 TaxID=2975949 RepID=UPI002DD82480|nr:hypothetical protein [Streptosporangium sp. NBC_01755]WSD01431.1 hypothetical protein OG884_05760 [Streptosporangium sp. NBC_01755]